MPFFMFRFNIFFSFFIPLLLATGAYAVAGSADGTKWRRAGAGNVYYNKT